MAPSAPKRDKCYYKVKASYSANWPSARASQALAKCRKSHGKVRHGKAGESLRRWQKEDWRTTHNKPCGASSEKGAYCRPTKRVSSKTPRLQSSLSKSQLAAKRKEKRTVGPRHHVSSLSK